MGDDKKEKTVVFAPHDDGFGAFETLCRVARALAGEATNANCDLRMIFLNSSAAGKGQSDLEKAVPGGTATYELTDNLITIPPDPSVGGVQAAGLPTVLGKVRQRMDDWPCNKEGKPVQLEWRNKEGKPVQLEWKNVDLAISMGVPWVHRLARQTGIPSVEVGDMCFSLVLRGCLEEAQLPLSSPDKQTLSKIAEYERMAREAWLLPFMAPREYEDHFASADVPVNWMPGVLWTGGPVPDDPKGWEECNKMREAPKCDLSSLRNIGGLKIVRVEAGKRGVWKEIVDALKGRPNQGQDAPAVITVEGSDVVLLEGGGITLNMATDEFRRHENTQSRASASRALYAAVDLGLTRGGGSALGFIAGRTPVALAEERFHWLSRRQRESLVRAGLCLPVSLDEFRQNPEVLIANLLEDPRLEDVRKRTYGIRVGAERDLARYLFQRYLDP